jgi:sugar phosphate isomerase/epimerase
VYGDLDTPEKWIAALRREGYTAAYCPVGLDASDDVVHAYEKAASEAGVVIAEVGAWSSPLAPDATVARAGLERCKRALDLADRIDARCCVNISGSRGPKWDGPSPLDMTPETFDMIVACARDIIDTVKPRRTAYTLEPMPWMYPDTPECYLRLVRAIDRKQFGVHLDPVNMVSSPQLYYANGELIRECFRLLGSHVRSCHAKDTVLREQLTTHLDEVRPGLGTLDYATLLRELAALPGDVPLMLEHLPKEEDYRLAAGYVRARGREVGLSL